jgi:hypothetical protein
VLEGADRAEAMELSARGSIASSCAHEPTRRARSDAPWGLAAILAACAAASGAGPDTKKIAVRWSGRINVGGCGARI